MRRIHLITGLLGVIAFLLTGQVMKHHYPRMEGLSAEVRMMYVSRHIYLLGASLVNVVLGLYLQVHPRGWRRVLQQIASVVILLSPLALLIAFFAKPAFGLAGRSWRSYFGLIGLFAGVMTHIVARAGLEQCAGIQKADFSCRIEFSPLRSLPSIYSVAFAMPDYHAGHGESLIWHVSGN